MVEGSADCFVRGVTDSFSVDLMIRHVLGLLGSGLKNFP
jgi:hypothetical protein